MDSGTCADGQESSSSRGPSAVQRRCVACDGWHFYIATGSGQSRKHVTCGDDPEAVRRAMRTQAHVMQLRAEGMDVPDAPEIEQSRPNNGDTLQTMVREFQEETPTGLGDKSVKKYLNAFRVFAQWSATVNVYSCSEVTAKHVTKWSQWLGHKDLATTRIYLRALSAEMAQPQVESSTLATQYSARLVKPEGRAKRGRDVHAL